MDVAVIGAGQAGLAVAYHLRHLGPQLAVVDAGPAPGGAWQHRWPSLTLGRTHALADLPGMRDVGLSFSSGSSTRPARELVPDLMGRYETAYGITVARPTRVAKVTREEGWFVVEASPGSVVPRLEARVLVNATGTWTHPRTPELPGIDSFEGIQADTPRYPGAEAFAGLRVAVVGGGLSAIGFLDELAGVARATRWYTRRPVEVLDDASSELGLARGRGAVAAQDAAAREGLPLPSIVSATGIPATPPVRRLRAKGLLEAQPMPTRVVVDGLQERDGSVWQADAILWAIGFSPALDHLAPLQIAGPTGGVRVVDGRVVGVPGLLLAGYGGQASTISSARAARRTARHVEEHLSGADTWPMQPSP